MASTPMSRKTRSLVLSTLGTPRPTTEIVDLLAEHDLSERQVSYALGRLVNAGKVGKRNKNVYFKV